MPASLLSHVLICVELAGYLTFSFIIGVLIVFKTSRPVKYFMSRNAVFVIIRQIASNFAGFLDLL